MIFTVTVIVIVSLLEHVFALPCIGQQGSTCDCSGTDVVCRLKNLTAIPEDVPLNTTSLDLSNNKISTIAANAFDDLVSLEELDLEGNNLSCLPMGVFSSNINLVLLDLADNALTTISPNIFRNMTNLNRISLNGNPLVCCKIIDFFKWAARQTNLTLIQGSCIYLNTTRFLNQFNISNCPIPVDGHWGPWSSVTCSVTCGKGLGIRTRRCDNPPSSGDGNGCFGCDIEKKLCSLEKCRKSCNNAGKNSKSDGDWKKARKSKMISNHRFMKNSMK